MEITWIFWDFLEELYQPEVSVQDLFGGGGFRVLRPTTAKVILRPDLDF